MIVVENEEFQYIKHLLLMKFNTHDPFVFDNVIFFWNQCVWKLQRLKIRIANGSQRFLYLHHNFFLQNWWPRSCLLWFYYVFNHCLYPNWYFYFWPWKGTLKPSLHHRVICTYINHCMKKYLINIKIGPCTCIIIHVIVQLFSVTSFALFVWLALMQKLKYMFCLLFNYYCTIWKKFSSNII